MKKQMSESKRMAYLLVLTGGFFDAYTYMFRGKKFATMQTGNLILFAYNIFNKSYSTALMYLIPIFAFFVGAFFAQVIEHKLKNNKKMHWRQISLLIEIIVVIPAIFIPSEYNFVANMLISFVSGVQTHSFRKVSGLSMATTMCTGNLKKSGEVLAKAFLTKNKKYLKAVLLYMTIIMFFVIGVLTSFYLTSIFNQYAVAFALIPLVIAFCIMFIEIREEEFIEQKLV